MTTRVFANATLPLCALLFGVISPPASAQNAAAPPAQSATARLELDAATEPLLALRDDFIARAKALGFTCKLAPPKIVFTDVPSFGNYDPVTNTLETPLWTQLREEERALFFRLSGPGSDELTAHRFFERGTHHWVFVHELGHWWLACTGAEHQMTHYAAEQGANRIAAAYWREADPPLMDTLQAGFRRVLENAPNPVPPGQDPQEYFNANYDKLVGSPAYPWFQAKMISEICSENPQPTFAHALAPSQAPAKE